MEQGRTYIVRRDRWAEGLGIEEMCLFASELSEREILALAPADRVEALREIGCVIEDGCVVADPALDAVERVAA